MDDGGIYLLDEHRQVALEGARYADIIPLLDGSRTVAEVASQLQDRHGFPQVLHTVAALQRAGYVVEGDGEADVDPGLAAFAEYRPPGVRGMDGGGASFGSGLPAVHLRTVGNLDPGRLAPLVEGSGLSLEAGASLGMVFTDDYLRPGLEALDSDFRGAERPWMLVKPVGMVLWVGPIFVPGTTGCWTCLAHRLTANRQVDKYVADRRGPDGEGANEPIVNSLARLDLTLGVAVALAATEAARWKFSNGVPNLEGRLLTLDLKDVSSRMHQLVRRPQCPACGDPDLRRRLGQTRAVLGAGRKVFTADGGHRVAAPWETFERYQHHVSPVLGAVTDVQPALGSRPGIAPSYVAGHNFAMGVDSVVFLRDSLRGMSGGKGATDIQAEVSALCEAIERYSGLYWGDEAVRRGSFIDLEGAIHPNSVMGFSDAQFQHRESWNASQPPSRCVLVPHPFDPSAELDWTPVHSVLDGTRRYLPTALLYYGHPEFDGRQLLPDSNGCAAGNSFEEAVLQGLLELVERDAVAIWWYNRIRRRGVDPRSFGSRYLQELEEYYGFLGRNLWFLDITSDFGVPTFAALSRRLEWSTEDIILGFGSHLDPRIALLRAATELNQFLPAVGLANPNGSSRYLFGDELAKQWWRAARVGDLDYLTPDPERTPATLADFPVRRHDEIRADVLALAELAAERDLHVYLLDQTLPDIGLPVARVVAPGMCHFWRRFGHSRLLQVPVEMGWLQEPLGEDQLNPFSVFF